MANAHDFSLTTIDGKPLPLRDLAGKAVLFVNVASQCGYTPQYAGLEALHRAHKDRGLVVVGVPCNQFGAQEPGTESQIAAFCEKNYGVTFTMSSKVDVNGAKAHPLYAWLTDGGKDPVKWNFAKFLVGKDGARIGHFASGVKPDSKELAQAIDKALA